MADPFGADGVNAEFKRLVEAEFGESLGALAPGPPMLLIRPARLVEDGLLGKRLRFLVIGEDSDGRINAFGWRPNLRARSDRPAMVDDADEPVVWVSDEAAYYDLAGGVPTTAVGISRLWVEDYIGVGPDPVAPLGAPNLTAGAANPMEPLVRGLEPVLGCAEPLGRRAVVFTERGWEPDWRVAGQARETSSGELVVPVMEEAWWYRWTALGELPTTPFDRIRMVPTRDVRLE